MAQYLIITGDNCPYCDKAKELLKSNPGVIVKEVHVLDAQEEMKGTNGKVPQIWHILNDKDRIHIGGYDRLTEYLALR
jgi:glutaredoxin